MRFTLKLILAITLLYVFALGLITAANPELGFEIATYTGIIVAQPITMGLRIGLFLRNFL